MKKYTCPSKPLMGYNNFMKLSRRSRIFLMALFCLVSFDLYSDSEDLDLKTRQYRAKQAILANMNQQRFRIQPRHLRPNQQFSNVNNPGTNNQQQAQLPNYQFNQQTAQVINGQMPNNQVQTQYQHQQVQNPYYKNQAMSNQQHMSQCPTCRQSIPMHMGQNNPNLNNLNQRQGFLHNGRKAATIKKMPFTQRKLRRFR